MKITAKEKEKCVAILEKRVAISFSLAVIFIIRL